MTAARPRGTAHDLARSRVRGPRRRLHKDGIRHASAIWYALATNAAVLVVKAIAAALTGSGAMLAEALHSVADTGNQLLLLLGVSRAQRSPS